MKKSDFNGKVVFVGLGNVMKADDGFGPLLAERLSGRVSFKVFDAGLAPENYLCAIIDERPDTVVFADAGDFGGDPGETGFFDVDGFFDSSFFLTHNSSLKMLVEFLRLEGSEANIFLLCLQPKSVSLAAGLSSAAVEKLRELSEWFVFNFPSG